jgi:hypothetical protein
MFIALRAWRRTTAASKSMPLDESGVTRAA